MTRYAQGACRQSLAALLITLAWSIQAPLASAAAPIQRPNILFILADDYGIDGVGCYGSDRFQGKTPHLDALAETGTRFERCYATPICGTTRSLFITGRYGFRTGALSNEAAERPRPDQEPSVAKVLKQAGYVTGMAGKWRQFGGTAGEWGFDEYLMSDIAGSPTQIKSYTVNGKQVQVPEGEYYPDVQQEFALNFLRQHRQEPFFFYYASHLVHDPILGTPDSRPGEQNKKQLYDDNVAYLDKQVGQLVAELNKLQLRERTLIIFSADNGTDMGRGAATIGGRMPKGGKRDLLEGGTRVPLIANWQGTVPAGRVLKDLIDLTDLLPTFAEFGGAKLPQGITIDGRSFAPQLRGETGTPREWVFVQLGPSWFARSDRWKLNSSGELFDMSDAPFVERPVADDKSPPAAAARKQLQVVLAQLDPAAGKRDEAADNQLSPAEKTMGWKLLFNGQDLEGWQCNNGKPIATPVEDGCLVPFKAGGYLIVHKDLFGDFRLQCDVKLSSDECNSGIFVRVGDLLKPVQTGIEMQVAKGGDGFHDFGAIYDLVPPSKNVIKPAGEWNHVEITCRGPLMTVMVNGQEVSRINCDEFDQPGLRPDGTKHKFALAIKDMPRRGYLGFQDHGHKVWYKNVKLLELKP